jgi:antitoxin (DNA-binding transcriptional repressor) of toxin-antitoxin stability system
MAHMTATEVSRNFSAVINRVDSGEQIEIVRNGKPIAELRRPSKRRGISGAELKALLKDIPPADEDFARDVEEARRRILAPVDKWHSS